MGYEIQKADGALIVKVYGEFDLHAADYARRDIDKYIKSEGIKHVIFDLEGLTFIDSSGLGVILGRYRKVSENGGQVAISAVPQTILKVMEISGLTRLISFYDNSNSALKSLS